MKTRKLYEIRIVRKGNVFSHSAGRRLRVRARALKLARYLKRKGHDAFAAPLHVTA